MASTLVGAPVSKGPPLPLFLSRHQSTHPIRLDRLDPDAVWMLTTGSHHDEPALLQRPFLRASSHFQGSSILEVRD